MANENKSGRLLGQILLDCGFVSDKNLARALTEQRNSNDLLGQILVRMGAIEESQLKAALSVQDHIGTLEEAVRSAAGIRQMLGSLLITARHITSEQLDHAIELQRASDKKLGEIFIHLGILGKDQLDCLLQFQQNQEELKRSSNPFRLGEILITTGHITPQQLDDALLRQEGSTKKIGEILVEEGYATPCHINKGIHLQQRLISAALAAILAFSGLSLSGCGSGGVDAVDDLSAAQSKETSVSLAKNESDDVGLGFEYKDNMSEELRKDDNVNLGFGFKTNYMTVTKEDFGLVQPTFYYSTVNQSFWSIQASVAKSVHDINSKCVMRIDIQKPAGNWPALNKTYSIEDSKKYDKFPGSFLVLNGKLSTKNRVESGTISFSRDSVTAKHVRGSFSVILTEYESGIFPHPQYTIKGVFSFKMGDYGPA